YDIEHQYLKHRARSSDNTIKHKIDPEKRIQKCNKAQVICTKLHCLPLIHEHRNSHIYKGHDEKCDQQHHRQIEKHANSGDLKYTGPFFCADILSGHTVYCHSEGLGRDHQNTVETLGCSETGHYICAEGVHDAHDRHHSCGDGHH